jgi:hypothetical protein
MAVSPLCKRDKNKNMEGEAKTKKTYVQKKEGRSTKKISQSDALS